MRYETMIATVILGSFATTFASAAEVLDQQNDVTGSATADSTSSGAQELAQTFTVGVAGTLSRIEAQLSRPSFTTSGSVLLTVYNTTIAGVPDASLGAASLPWDAIPTTGYAFQSFDVSALAISIHVGDVLAASIRSDALFFWRSSFNMSTYGGGESKARVLSLPPGPWASYSPSHDNGFRTYVNASASLPGDYNGDGKVDAADYVAWRSNTTAHGGTPAGYNSWRANFGAPGSGTMLGSTVPEPGSLLPLAVVCFWPTRPRLRLPTSTG